MWTNIRNVNFSKMRILKMFITAVCVVFITAESFILLVIAGTKLRDPVENAKQFSWSQLCMFFVKTVVNATLARETVTTTAIASSTPATMVENSCTTAQYCRTELHKGLAD